ncbi:MAG: electron transport complex subunit RsxA [Pseudomonadales bacterium]|nr:electron transport complex subunit RsxA [Pseudomonadales bacterium]MCP5182410.1 electron transport complex subunit RsxA [Pseudomonadales bacterium]
MGELISLLFGALLVNNFVLAQFLGLCPFFGTTRQYETALAMGLATTFVLTFSASLCHVVYHQVLVPLDLDYLRIVVFIVVIATAVELTERYIKATSRQLYQLLGIYLPLITTNCAVLGVALLAIQRELSFVATLFFAIGAALGFSLVLTLFAALRERLEHAEVPAAMQGTPLMLVSAGILSLAFLGFTGMGH